MSDAKTRFSSITMGHANIRLITMFCSNGMYYEVAKWEGEWVIIWSRELPTIKQPSNQEEHFKTIQEQQEAAATELVKSLRIKELL